MGTANDLAVKKLLHLAVSDVSDDVRRAAVTALGFLLFRNPTQVPRMVQLLSESYNPGVRYGATLALGIACAGTALPEAVDMLLPMTKDSVDYVRQGALISLSLVLVQANSVRAPKMMQFREKLATIAANRHEDPLAKMGAAVAQGIIDAGGRNVTISLGDSSSIKMQAVVGLTLFAQYWFWFPMAHSLSLALEPTAVIGITKELKVGAVFLLSTISLIC